MPWCENMKEPGQKNYGISNDILLRLYQFISWNTSCAKRSDCNIISMISYTSYDALYQIGIWYDRIIRLVSYQMVSWQKLSSSTSFHAVDRFERYQYHIVGFVWFGLLLHDINYQSFLIQGCDSFILCVWESTSSSAFGLSRTMLWLLWYCLCWWLLQFLHYFVTQLIVIFIMDLLIIFIFC